MNLPLPSPELYHLVNDPDESHDRAARNPAVVADILARVAQAMQSFPIEAVTSWQITAGMKVLATPVGALPVLAS